MGKSSLGIDNRKLCFGSNLQIANWPIFVIWKNVECKTNTATSTFYSAVRHYILPILTNVVW